MAGTQYSDVTGGLGLNGESPSGVGYFSLNKSTIGIGNADSEGLDFELHFTKPSGGQAMKSVRWIEANRTTAGVPDGYSDAGTVTPSSAINAVRFLFSSGNIAQGAFKLYGVRK